MINPDVKLNKKLFDKRADQKATRDGFGEGLVEAGKIDPAVVALCADVTESTRTEEFSKKFPERFFEMGVAEQNMASVAAGLGVSGKIPYISSYAVFSPGRNYEQIRTTIAYNDSNVKIAGHHAGISTGPDGATHQATEDIAIMRAMPNMKVFVPCDAIEAKKATMAAAKIWGPVYLRFQREKTPIFTTEDTPFSPGNAEIFWQSRSPQVLIIGCGPILYDAIVAAKELDENGIGSIVLNCHTIKPLDEDKIAELAKKCGAVVTVEEHQITGGLGGAVAEALAKNYPAPVEFVGMQDVFGESGTAKELMDKFNLEAKDIKTAVKKVIKRK
ncbi:MAG: transketolase C-terminal domain-containing protein [Candidatus Pacebacteria bacterium]|nr:transketolase C-terminal domain-containing protein [Candidatus Paceibacterota bacterium]